MLKNPETIRTVKGPTILLHSGAYFDLLAPEESGFTIDDIAHGLSNTCRFAGQSNRFYSVAEHSVHVSRFVKPENAYAALMHDASEAFIHDISKPLKSLLPEYQAIEQRIEAVIAWRFDVPAPLPDEVSEIDIRMLITEQKHLIPARTDWDYMRGREPLPLAYLPCWSPDKAKRVFLHYFEKIRGDK